MTSIRLECLRLIVTVLVHVSLLSHQSVDLGFVVQVKLGSFKGVYEAVQVVFILVQLLVPQVSQSIQNRLHAGFTRGRCTRLALHCFILNINTKASV